MKSKYKLKIKEIFMRLKSSLFFLLGVLCLFVFAQGAVATDWTDPTCAAPGCNTNGPIWVNPDNPQNSSAISDKPMIYIWDQRESSTPEASAYVRSQLNDKPAIYAYSTGTTATSYGGVFVAANAPGLKVKGGVVITPLSLDPTWEEGLLYLNSGNNQFRYYSGGHWRILNPFVTSDDDYDGIHELYYSVPAGNQRGVAIKNGDTTGPTDEYTLDVYRKTSSDHDYYKERALYARLASYSSDDNYASGFIGGYDGAAGNLIGVRGKVNTSGTGPHYGGYFEATGLTGYGVLGTASYNGATMNIGGSFSAFGTSGIGVSGNAPAYGGFFQTTGSNGVGVAAYGPSTQSAMAYAIKTKNGAIAMGEISTIPNAQSDEGMLYVKADGADNKIYFKSAAGTEYDLTAGSGAGGNIADGTVTGQMTYWNNTAGEWQPIASTDMLWNNTTKNLGVGTNSPSAANKLHVVQSANFGSPAAISANTTTNIVAGTSYGAYVTATNSAIGGNIYGIYSTATGKGSVYGGYFTATGGAINKGIEGHGTDYGVAGYSDGDGGAGVYGESFLVGVVGYGIGVDGIDGYGGYFSTGCKADTCAGVYGVTANGAASRGVEGISTADDALESGYGGYFSSAGGTGIGVRGIASYSANSNINYGGHFTAAGGTGIGVRGIASYSGNSNLNFGGYFTSAGTAGVGVYANASGEDYKNNTYGAFLVAPGSRGTGVYGAGGLIGGDFKGTTIGIRAEASATGVGNAYAGHFTVSGVSSEENTVAAVYGSNTLTTGINYGGQFIVDTGRAVYGQATGIGANYGGYFTAAGITGRAVYGEATGTTGNNYGGYFSSSSNTGWGVYGLATGTTGRAVQGYASGTGSNYGGYFQADGSSGRGVSAFVSGSAAYAVEGSATYNGTGTTYGGYFTSASSSGIGVRGQATGTTGQNYGGYFISEGSTGRAVYGQATGTTGQNYGGYFTSAGTTGRAVYGISTSTGAGGGGDFRITGANNSGYALYAYNSGTTNTGYGIYAINTSSTGYAAAFNGRIRMSNIDTVAPDATLYISSAGLVGRTSSSRRYKDNIVDMEDISWLYELRPVNFTYKIDKNKSKYYGLIAEEVESINKALVIYNEENVVDGIEYTRLISPLLKALQTQKQQLDALETKVEMMEKNGCANNEAVLMEYIEKLEARLEALEAKNSESSKTSFWSKFW